MHCFDCAFVLHNKYYNKLFRYKWFAILSEDTFLIAENLRYYLSILDITKSIYLGKTAKFHTNKYISFKEGIVLNRKTLNKLQSHLYKKDPSSINNDNDNQNDEINQDITNTLNGMERSINCRMQKSLELGLGHCLSQVAVSPLKDDSWLEKSFTAVPFGFYFNFVRNHDSLADYISDMFKHKVPIHLF